MNELKSYTEYAVSTPTADFVIGFDFNYGEDAVNVTVDNVPATTAGYTVVYLNETTIRLSPSVPSGVVRLQRETDIDQTDHAYRAGAKFIAQTMDENFEQLRHSQQEVRDGFSKLSEDTYAIIDTLQDVGQAAQDAADAAEQAAITANDAAAQVNDKVSQAEIDYIHENGAALPYKEGVTYGENAVVLKDGVLQQRQGGEWSVVSEQEVKKYLLAAGVTEDELSSEYNYLMQRLAQIAIDKGWDASFVVDGSMTQKQINAAQKLKNELWIDITDKLTDSATNNVAVLNQAIVDAKAQNKGIRCAPRSTVNLNADVDFSGVRFIDFKADILLSAGKKVIIGGFSQSALTCYFKFATVEDGSSIFGAPPAAPTFRVAGLKNAVLELGTTNYLQLYADANDATKNSTAYNDIKLIGWIPKFEITDSGAVVGGVGGWVNENRIWGGRINWLRMAGISYVHNHNKFYNNTFEGDKVRLDFINVWTNQIYGARFEEVAAASGVSFDATSMENSVEQTWTGTGNTNSQFDFSPKVTDLGKANICYTHYSTIFTKTELFSVNPNTLVSDGITTASQHYYFGRPKSIFTDYPNFVPYLTNFTVSAYRLIALTDMIPVKVGDSVKFDADYDGALLRPLIWCYDDNQKLITDITGGDLIDLISGTFDGERYSTGANLPSDALATGFSISNSRVKYIQVSVFSGSAGTVRHLSAHLYTQNLKRAKSITSANTRIKVPQLANDVTKGFVPVGFEIYNSTFKNRNHVTFALETRLSATANATGTAINIVNATGIKNGDIVGVQLDDGTTHWSKVSNLSGTTHSIDALPSIASQNARVVYNRWAVINYSVALNAATYASGVTTLTYTVVGAVIGQKVMVNYNKSLGALIAKGDVTATDTVTVTVYNPTAAGIAVVAGNIYLSIE